ncbi:hypothetical protein A210_23455 [Pseudomonas putida SJTE-1]|jgi:HNH endonuclease|uniref:HNH endonuclease n=1 Tax=Pseudomonas juntendi TaxID=2666183 RepID=A0A7W2QWW4_9PSED|nr:MULTISPECIES: HNH endonuclease [Pseudomonas]MDI9777422.1 HNH endonuclease [Pseudomonas putida]ANI05477.1 hypothetical protein A210_23455 [Pseudomonas putida SJTE-1]MBA6145812.1 HNH endonuclease [Pseudomonas juntendi]MDH1573665.1 HNH endonuclease [Pseudomonas sp. GD03746]WBM34293.1 HNH endonuclease [Pseudomonas sp. NY11382]
MPKATQAALCCVPGCLAVANRKGARMCEKHYTRQRRTGTTDQVSRVKSGLLTNAYGYKLAHSPDHPLRRQSNRVYEHRIVYHAHHGDGPFACHWCSAQVTWDDMHVDHLNDRTDDNRPDNLVASCARCNQKRGLPKMTRTHQLKSDRRYTAHGKTMCLSEWSRHLSISRAAIEYRLKAGWRHEDVFSPRKGRSGPPSRRVKQAEEAAGLGG